MLMLLTTMMMVVVQMDAAGRSAVATDA